MRLSRLTKIAMPTAATPGRTHGDGAARRDATFLRCREVRKCEYYSTFARKQIVKLVDSRLRTFAWTGPSSSSVWFSLTLHVGRTYGYATSQHTVIHGASTRARRQSPRASHDLRNAHALTIVKSPGSCGGGHWSHVVRPSLKSTQLPPSIIMSTSSMRSSCE